MKKIVGVVMMVCMLLALLPANNALADSTYGCYTYILYGNTATITGVDTSISGENIIIPSKIYGYTVDTIGDEAFYNCWNLKSITIPENVSIIGERAFWNCDGLTSINIPDNCIVIGTEAFYSCENLISINIPDKLMSINPGAFYGCKSLKNISIPNKLKVINRAVFHGCESLMNITIPSSVSSIGGWAFCGCKNLTSINIPDSVVAIDSYAFISCEKLSSIRIPRSVVSVGSYAMSSCRSLSDVYYDGSADEWKNIEIASNNFAKTNATIHYNYADKAIINISSCIYENEKLTVNISLDNNITKSSSMVFAVYDGKKLVCVKEYPVTVGQTSVPVELAADKNYKDYTVKAFCVDSLTGMKSLSNTVSTDIQ